MSEPAFAVDGFALVAQVLSVEECTQAGREVQAGAVGTRCMLSQHWCRALAARLRAHPALAAIIATDLVAVQCTSFAKSADRNWLVPMHQDLSIPVAARVDGAGLSGWSMKEGIQFVRSPVEVLSQLVAVRIHLDSCGTSDGPLRVVPRSHMQGILSDGQAIALRAACGETGCVAPAGSALVMRPLLLHASSRGNGSSARRVLHFVFGPRDLPHGLTWHTAL